MWKRDYFYRKAECTGCFRRGNTGNNCFRYSPFLLLFNGDHCRSVTVLLERGILMLKTLVFGL